MNNVPRTRDQPGHAAHDQQRSDDEAADDQDAPPDRSIHAEALDGLSVHSGATA
jgi:hypothetical protein